MRFFKETIILFLLFMLVACGGGGSSSGGGISFPQRFAGTYNGTLNVMLEVSSTDITETESGPIQVNVSSDGVLRFGSSDSMPLRVNNDGTFSGASGIIQTMQSDPNVECDDPEAMVVGSLDGEVVSGTLSGSLECRQLTLGIMITINITGDFSANR